MTRNGLPEPKPYVYRGNGSGLSDAEAASALGASREARAAVPVPEAPKRLKGAVKVEAFPDRSKYPFAEIAKDGGVWKLDPAAYNVKPNSIYMAARTWAEGRNLAAKVVMDSGFVYVQFNRPEPEAARRRAELDADLAAAAKRSTP